MNAFEQNLEKYAEVAVKVGINLKKGQGVLLSTSIEGLPLARKVQKKAYEAGAKHVEVKISDDEMRLNRYKFGSDQVFEEFPEFIKLEFEKMVEEDYTLINVMAPNPELLKEIDPSLVAKDSKTRSIALESFMKATMNGTVKWNVLAVASKAWAKMVFPELEEEKAMESLWDQIFKISRIDNADPVHAWKTHDANLKHYSNYLTEKNFEKMKYTAEGTDLEVYLADEHVWIAGGNKDNKGDDFLPNIPTEEVFSMPHYKKVNGTLKSTKPLSVRGQFIDGFGFTFENGKVVDFYAETGYEVLEELLNTDEGARHLGEIALVPYDSPISNSGLIFSNTLYDENASCHFALGKAYSYNLKNGTKLEKEELEKRGANHSLIHVDFMVGSSNLKVVGITFEGEEIVVFENGDWAI